MCVRACETGGRQKRFDLELLFVFHGFAWRTNYHARSTLTRTHSRAFEVKRYAYYMIWTEAMYSATKQESKTFHFLDFTVF